MARRRPGNDGQRSGSGNPRQPGLVSMANIGQDLRLGARMLGKNPVFTSVAIVILALGIGANTAMFSTMNAVLLRSLPVAEPERTVYLETTCIPRYSSETGYSSRSFSGHTFAQLREQTPPVLSDLMAYVPLSPNGEVAVRFDQQPETARVIMVSGNFFSGLGVPAAQGRTLSLPDESSRAPVAVISHAFRTRRFADDSSVLGKGFGKY